MDFSIPLALTAIALPVLLHLLTRANKPRHGMTAKLPPGSLGLPVIGQSLGLLRAMRTNTDERWIQGRVDRYGPVSKLSLFGAPTVLLTGPAANKFVFFSGALALQQPRSVQRILGERNLLELSGADHRRIRGALAEFLKPDMLRLYVGRIDGEVRRHLDAEWAGRRTVTVMPLMKRLTFDIISSLLFGLERGAARDALAADFMHLIDGMWDIPVDLPFTAFRRSLRASARARRVIKEIARETEVKLERGETSRNSDLIACLLSLTDGSGARQLTVEEIVDSSMVALVAGHDTSSVLMTFMVRHLASDPDTLAAMIQGNNEPPML
jgi:cytochrome P450